MFVSYPSLSLLWPWPWPCRGSLGFGEEALQSILGKIGSQVTSILSLPVFSVQKLLNILMEGDLN